MFGNLTTKKIETLITILSILFIIGIPQYGVILAFVIVFVYLRRSKNRSELLTSIGLKRPKNLISIVIICLILGILIELATEIISNPIIEKITHSKIDLSKVDLSTFSKYLIWVLIGFVLGGFLEEVLFRGFLLTRISSFFKENKVNDILALMATSILFGLCHYYQGWSGVISTGLIGLLLGIIFLVFNKNLWYSILTHGFINLTAITILYFGYYQKLETLIFK
ncbi:MAG: CPBP family intramembrane glutamic endopeptidase [Chitinophagales bacterium]